MVQVRHVRMIVSQLNVAMWMGVGLGDEGCPGMLMLMMRIVDVGVIVFQGLVRV